MKRQSRAFTLVELLIVIVVIAILASISVVTYNGIQGRGYDAAVQQDLRKVAQLLEIYKLDNGRYPTGPLFSDYQANLNAVPMKLTTDAYSPTRLDGNAATNINYLDENTSGSNYAIIARTKSKKLYYINSITKSVKEYTGTYANGYPAVGTDNLAGDLGLDRTANNTYSYSIYNPPSFRHWN